MATCVFNVQGNDVPIQCSEQDTMENICKKLASKASIDLNKNIFLYNGLQIDMDTTYERLSNEFDKERKQINVVVFENNENESTKDVMRKDLIKKGIEILRKHLDGRSYKEEKVYDWINFIINDFESYFYQKYPSYNLFSFCFVCSKFSFYLTDNKSILAIEEAGSKAVFSTNDIHSAISFFFYKNFVSFPSPYLEPKLIKLGNKLLYEIFDERKFTMGLQDLCIRFNKEIGTNILEMSSGRRRCLIITYAFKKPAKEFCFNYRTKRGFDVARIIQTLITDDIEIWHFLFIVSNDN